MLLLQEKYWEDFTVGEKIKTGSVTVTETHLVNFAGLTGDFYPLHSDEEYCKNTIFKTRIIHGPLTFCLAKGLLVQSHYLGSAVIALKAVENMVFHHPVYPGDTISLEVLVDSKRETSKPHQGITTFIYWIHNQRQETVLEVKCSILMKRRM